MVTGVTFRDGIWVCLRQPLTHVYVAWEFLDSVPGTGVRG